MKDLYEFPGDSMIATDEWDHVRYMIGEELKICDFKGTFLEGHLPFFSWFRGEIKDKLIKAGFKKEIIENPHSLDKVIKVLNEQGHPKSDYLSDYLKHCGFPEETITLSENKKMFWVKSDIEAALRTLEFIRDIKRAISN